MHKNQVKLFQPFHLVMLSPWPLLVSFSMLSMMVSIIKWFNYMNMKFMMLFMVLLFLILFQWWRDVVRESMFQGFHTLKVIEGLKLGMILFIISEVFFFFSIFWCYFHMFLSPGVEIGLEWPPYDFSLFDPYSIPLLNTVILLSSGVTITYSHHSLIKSNYKKSSISLLMTIMLGLIFSLFQLMEYISADFSINDSVFGSIFFMATGFHGFHVLLGTIFLLVNYIRMINKNFSKIHYVGFEVAVWYWHFVDVVWLFLYMFIYFLIY